jgi:TPR repeat protein
VGACGLLAGLSAAAVAVVLAPFALVGFLVGPAAGLDLSRLLGPAAAWLAFLGVSMGAIVLGWKGSRAVYRAAAQAAAPRAAPASVPGAGWRTGTSVVAGLLTSVVVCGVVATLVLSGAGDSPAQTAALPATDQEKQSYPGLWLPKARAGDAHAQVVVGLALQRGRLGRPVDRSAAKAWLEKSAAQGDPDARLSLLVAQRTGSFDTPQDFQIARPLAAFADTQQGWRRAAIALMLAHQPPVSVGSAALDPAAQDRWQRQWLEQAALHGSHHAALELARRLERWRDPQGQPAPDLTAAMRWYAAAGATLEVDRLELATGVVLLPQDLPVLRQETPTPELLERLQRRAQWAGPRNAATSITLESLDAQMHAIVHGEARKDYLELGDSIMNPPPERGGADRSLAAMYYLLAMRQGQPQARARLEAMGLAPR